jgi:hypothetical protein
MRDVATGVVYYETEAPEITRDGDNFLIVSKLGAVELKRVVSRRTLYGYVNAALAAIAETDRNCEPAVALQRVGERRGH